VVTRRIYADAPLWPQLPTWAPESINGWWEFHMNARTHVSPPHHRPGRDGRRGLRPATAVVTAILTALSTFTFAVPAGSEVLSGVEASTLGRAPQMTPDDLGVDALDGLQYPDPATGLDLVVPPQVDQQGGAGVAHALSVPRGRAGVQPDLALTYDSGGGNGWVGLGWDLSLGAVEVDTRWGVPLMCPAGGALCGPDGARDVESETYLLDGDVLAPTSVRPSFEPRVADRADWVRRAETEWERVVRHGSSPADYWWEVTDKLGTHRFYGATPDGTRDPDSIISSADGAVHWGLSAVVDISGNTMVVDYDSPPGSRVGLGASIGTGFYVRSITYTGSLNAEDSPAYTVKFLRDGDTDASGAPVDGSPRPDVVVNASAGALQVTSDLLRRVEVVHGGKGADASRDFTTTGGGTGALVKAWELRYETGPFDKSLLVGVDQVGGDEVVGGSHTFDYFDEVRPAGTAYEGFGAPAAWTTGGGGNDLQQSLLSPVGLSALGASEANGGGGRAYLGFNFAEPKKTGSFGGSLAVNGGATDALVEMLDLNGDQLPDKVYRKSIFERTVYYRLNQGAGSFGPQRVVADLTRLSTEGSIGVSGGPEAYFGFTVAFNVALDVSIGAAYFEDANNDGRVDFVSDGSVLFNTDDGAGGVRFSSSSEGTAVPVVRGADVDVDLSDIQALQDVNEQQRALSPLQDVVRRWVAPWDGTVAVTGDVTFSPPDLAQTPSAAYASDGVRVAVQHERAERWSAKLTTPGQTVTPSGLGAVQVRRGQALYFRVGSVEDGVRDRVTWQPVVSYTAVQRVAGQAPVPVDARIPEDSNGLDQTVFDAAAEFTLAGRPGTPVVMPVRGTVRLEGELTKTAVTSDDLALVVEKDGVVVVDRPIPAGFVGTVVLAEDLEVDASTTTTAADGSQTFDADQVVVRIAARSSVDPTVVDFRPRLFYTEAFDQAGAAVPTTQDLKDNTTGLPGGDGQPDLDAQGRVIRLVEVDVPWDLDLYPMSDSVVPVTPWQAEESVDATVRASVQVRGPSPAGEAVLTIKERAADGGPAALVATGTMQVPALGPVGVADVPVEVPVALDGDGEYFFDVTVRDPAVQAQVVADSVDVTVTWAGAGVARDVPETFRWSGRQGVFPIAHRGWAYAGYRSEGRAEAPVDPGAFVLDVADLPTGETEPTGFDDESFPDLSQRGSYPFVPTVIDVRLGATDVPTPVWQGTKASLHGAAGSVQSSRTAADQADITGGTGAGSGLTAPVKVGLTAPGLGLTLGLSALSASFSLAPSFGLLDYVDMNGDSFPDFVTPERVTFTGPTGGYLGDRSVPLDGPGVGADLTFGVAGGFNGSAIDIKASSGGDANTAQGAPQNAGAAGGGDSGSGGSAGAGGSADKDEAGVNVGGAFGVTAQFTNPVATPSGYGDELSETSSKVDTTNGAAFEWELSDVNGDGLPDRVSAGPGGVRVAFNLGYSFTPPVGWASGAFEGNESFAGNLAGTLGFNYNYKEVSGGLAVSESVDLARWTWQDVDGDGVVDQLHKGADGEVTVAFGSGSGVGTARRYGTLQTAEVNLFDGSASIPTGQQVAADRSSGVGGSVDFTIPIGPLCLVGCYFIINPGGSYERSLSSSEVQLADLDGDGAPDSVKSTDDGTVSVMANLKGRTNLLRSIDNPLGGQTRIDYSRDGNTVQQPNPIWVMASVEVDDGRDVPAVPAADGELDVQQGDGADVQVSTFTYDGDRYDPAEREMLGYAVAVEQQRDGALDAPVLRERVTRWDNETVFTAGLVVAEELRTPDGTVLQRTASTWDVVDVTTGEAAPVARPTTGAESLALLQEARGVVLTRVVQEWFDDAGTIASSSRTDFRHDELGNVTEQVDLGLPTTTVDDVRAVTTYSQCRDTSGVSQPETMTILAPDGTVLRQRDGSLDLCLNSVPIRLVERIDGDTDAVTEMTFDAWGSYNSITYPENADGERYRVDYVFDEDRRTDVASVTDSHDLVAAAEFDIVGMVTRRVDANDNATTYTYDGFGRLASVRAPDEQATVQPTVAYTYAPTAAGYAYAVAEHRDRFSQQPPAPAPGVTPPLPDTIDTVTFVDGTGRVTQTKHDYAFAQLDDDLENRVADAADGALVSGAVRFDALGRQVAQWWPRPDDDTTALTTFQTEPASYVPSVTTYTLRDQMASTSLSYGEEAEEEFLTTYAHSFTTVAAGGVPAGAPLTTTRDPLLNDPQRPAGETAVGKTQRTWFDVRGNLLAFEDDPAQADPLRTRYTYDRLGLLLQVVDSAGNETVHRYDGLGRRLSTDTPDAGLRTTDYDPAGNVVAEVTPNLRADGTEIRFDYEFDRLSGIDYPGAMTDVEYVYGDPGAAENGAGRLVGVTDQARFQTLGYDALGAVARETTTMRVHNLSPNTRDKLTFTTAFDLDSFGRMATVTYPDGEDLAHEYDSGGLLTGLEGTKACTELASTATALDATSTTLVVREVASTTPDLPFTVRLGGEQLRVTARQELGDGTVAYTVARGVNGTVEVPTAVAHPAGTKVSSNVAVKCTYRYLDHQEYDEFEDRRTRGTGNGAGTITSFDYLGRLERILTTSAERRVQDVNVTYDKADNVTALVNDLPAPVPNLFTGYAAQEYGYDPYYRLESARGKAGVAPDSTRTFTWDVDYDANGNVTRKVQLDQIAKTSGKGKPTVQKPTSYTFDMRFAGAGPHQLTSIGRKTYSYDTNGNLTGWVDPVTRQKRTVTWDAEDRITEIDDGSNDTTYAYDADGNRAIERGPDGETSFVNRWYTVRNGSVPWKQIWADDDRLATKRSFGGSAGGDYEHQVYYLHQDLQGSTHVVTDDVGKVFTRYEYFPGGEQWVKEDSNVHRTYWLYGGGYFDEVRGLLNFGARWYEPREGIFYSPDPLLGSDPSAAVDDPALLPAYSYAASSPIGYVDPTGYDTRKAGSYLSKKGFSTVGQGVGPGGDAAARAEIERSSPLWGRLNRFALSDRAQKLQGFADRWDAKPLVSISISSGPDGTRVDSVKLSPFGFNLQKEVYAAPDDQKQGSGAGGSPAGSPAVDPGSGDDAQSSGPAAVGSAGASADDGASDSGEGQSATSGEGGGPADAGSGSSSSSSRSSGSGGGAGSGSDSVGDVSGPPDD